jgi:hypothetical protein
MADARESSHLATKLDAKLLHAIVGRYELAPHADLTIWRNGDQLFGQARGEKTLQGMFDIYPESETNFLVKVTGAQLTFNKNAKREVTTAERGFRISRGRRCQSWPTDSTTPLDPLRHVAVFPMATVKAASSTFRIAYP